MTEKNFKKNRVTSIPDNEIFRLMFENHAAIMLLVDPRSGGILDANKAATRFYGYTPTKLRRMLISKANILAPDQIEQDRQKALNEKQNTFVFPHKLASGEIRTVEVHSTAIVNDISDRFPDPSFAWRKHHRQPRTAYKSVRGSGCKHGPQETRKECLQKIIRPK